MSAIRVTFRFLSRLFDTVRKVLHFFVLIILFSFLLALLSGAPPPGIPASGALLVDPSGPLVEQLSGDAVDRAFAELQGDAENATLVREIVAAIRRAKDDDRIKVLVLRLGGLAGGGLTKLDRVANAIEDFKTSGKKVLVYGDFYTQNQYLIAAHADEVYLHPSGAVFLEGYGRFRTYYKSAIDMLSIDWNIFKVGEFKSFVEPYFRDDMSAQDKASSIAWLTQLWQSYQVDVTAARGLGADAVEAYASEMVARSNAADGDLARVALEAGLVDALWTRDQFDKHVGTIAGVDKSTHSYHRAALADYVQFHGLDTDADKSGKNNIGVIVAAGQILDGKQPAGTIGGDTLAALIRKARHDESVKALVLHIDSGGGSKFASEIIQRELALWKETGRPLVTVMSSVAASGGYWIAMDGDEIWASPNTITGSIGIGGYFPTFQRTLDRIGVHVDGIGTTRWSGDFRPDRKLSDGASELLQENIQYGYLQFISAVAEARNMAVDDVDEIARGRVWSGVDAQELGLVDRMGTVEDAIASAANLAGLDDGYGILRIQKDLNFREELATLFAVRAKIWFGEELTGRRRPTSLEQIENALGLADLRKEIATLASFNDPRGLYYYCFCRAQ